MTMWKTTIAAAATLLLFITGTAVVVQAQDCGNPVKAAACIGNVMSNCNAIAISYKELFACMCTNKQAYIDCMSSYCIEDLDLISSRNLFAAYCNAAADARTTSATSVKSPSVPSSYSLPQNPIPPNLQSSLNHLPTTSPSGAKSIHFANSGVVISFAMIGLLSIIFNS